MRRRADPVMGAALSAGNQWSRPPFLPRSMRRSSQGLRTRRASQNHGSPLRKARQAATGGQLARSVRRSGDCWAWHLRRWGGAGGEPPQQSGFQLLQPTQFRE